MSTQSLESMITALFTAPARAAVDAEAGYRQIWADWLSANQKIHGADAVKDLLPMAPVLKIAGVIELSLSMRIASVSQTDGKVSLGAGPLSVSGGYFRQTSEESAMSVRATFTLTNAETDLSTYLSRTGLAVTDPTKLDAAITRLSLPPPKAS